jgi:hypothetical protein
MSGSGGFIKQSNRHVTLYSQEGQGTAVGLYLPRLLTDRWQGGGAGRVMPAWL